MKWPAFVGHEYSSFLSGGLDKERVFFFADGRQQNMLG